MGTEIQLASLDEIIRDKVKKTLFDTIPDEKVDALIKREWDNFFEKRGYHKNEPSLFQEVVSKEISKQLHEHLTSWVEKSLVLPDQEETIVQLTKKLAPEMQQAWFEGLTQGILGIIRSEMHNLVYKAQNNTQNRGY